MSLPAGSRFFWTDMRLGQDVEIIVESNPDRGGLQNYRWRRGPDGDWHETIGQAKHLERWKEEGQGKSRPDRGKGGEARSNRAEDGWR